MMRMRPRFFASPSAAAAAACVVLIFASAAYPLPDLSAGKKKGGDGMREQIVTSALSLVGVPYKYGGSSKKGFDCCGFVMYVYALNDIHLPRTSREQFTAGKQIDLNGIRKGDLLFYKINTQTISHVGIYIGNGQFVHSSVPGSCVRVERIDQPYWVKYFAGAATFLE